MQIPTRLTIAWLRHAYESGSITPREVVKRILERCADAADYNVWIVPPSEQALEPYLAQLDQSSPGADKPLWGVPFVIKDNIDLAGVPTTAACPAYAYTPAQSATVVAKLVDAGAIPLGKANLDQFATGLVGVRSPYGECRNALDPRLISGGSSSGSAVSVALGLAAFSLGTDTAGSGRVPAALNRLVGFKPPLGSWSTKGVVPACASLDCVTVFANTLEDAMAVDGVARGYDEDCPYSKAYAAAQGAALPAAICIPAAEPEFYGEFAQRYREGWHASLERIRRLTSEAGIEVRTMDCSYLNEAASVLYDGPWVAERWADLGTFVDAHPGEVFPVTEKILRSGARDGLSAESLFNAMHFLQECRHRVNAELEDAVLVMPTCGGTFTRAQVDADPIAANSKMGLTTNHCNLCDLTALAIPGDDSRPGLPFGITAFARADSQQLLEGFARRYRATARVQVAVCGKHMRGFEYHTQLLDAGAEFLGTYATAPSYRLFILDEKAQRPGLLKVRDGGASIEVEVYAFPASALGAFAECVPAPLSLGKVELSDGSAVEGMLVERVSVLDEAGAPLDGVAEITGRGSYRAWRAKTD